MAKKLGIDVYVEVSAAGVTYTKIGGQTGGSLNRSGSPADVTNKDSAMYKETIPGFKEWTVDCDGLYDEADAGYLIVETAHDADATLYVRMYDGTRYHTGQAQVKECSFDAGAEDATKFK